MTNLDNIRDKITVTILANSNLAVTKSGNITDCSCLNCDHCIFQDDMLTCFAKRYEWLLNEVKGGDDGGEELPCWHAGEYCNKECISYDTCSYSGKHKDKEIVDVGNDNSTFLCENECIIYPNCFLKHPCQTREVMNLRLKRLLG